MEGTVVQVLLYATVLQVGVSKESVLVEAMCSWYSGPCTSIVYPTFNSCPCLLLV